VIAGIDWVAHNHASPAVANLSLGSGASQAVDDAIALLTGAGVTVTVAAGNSGANACNYSPARAASAITVGATTSSDSRDTTYSNYGPCVDVFAPGTGITSDWKGAVDAINTLSGTSMASPHVAGVAALFLQRNAGASPADVATAIRSTATPSVLSSVGTDSPNLLVFSGLTVPATGPISPPPVTPSCGQGTTTTYTKTLTRGSWAYSPNISLAASSTGQLTGCLTGPAGTNFDLYLYRLSGSRWNQVAVNGSQTSTETISYPLTTAGTYRWGIKAMSGSGLATLISVTP
jgi:subtilisin family serine protease